LLEVARCEKKKNSRWSTTSVKNRDRLRRRRRRRRRRKRGEAIRHHG
jgi:hypothetical protein